MSVRLHLDCFPLEHLWLEYTTYISISRFINYFALLSNYHNDSKHSFLKINSLFIYIGNIYFGIYLNKNILVNVRYKRQDTLPFYIPQFKLSRKDIPLFYTPQFKRSRVQVLFLVYRSGCCFHSTRVACTLELGLRENGAFRPPEIRLFYSWYTGAGAVFTAHVLLAR